MIMLLVLNLRLVLSTRTTCRRMFHPPCCQWPDGWRGCQALRSVMGFSGIRLNMLWFANARKSPQTITSNRMARIRWKAMMRPGGHQPA